MNLQTTVRVLVVSLTLHLVLLGTAGAAGTTDIPCEAKCLKQGSSPLYCINLCTVDEEPARPKAKAQDDDKTVDYPCVSRCLTNGSSFNFCKATCSY